MKEDESSPLIVAGRVGLEYAPAGPWLKALTDPEIWGVLPLEPLAVEELATFVSEASRSSASVSDLDALIELLRSG